MKQLRQVLALFQTAVLWACASQSGQAQPEGTEPPTPQTSSAGAASMLLVASRGRVQLLDADGSTQAEATVDFGGAALVLVPEADQAILLTVDGSLHRVALPALTEQTLASALDTQNVCLTDSPASWLWRFSLAPEGDALCVELAREEPDVGRTYAQVRVSLADGSQVATTTVDEATSDYVGEVPFGACAAVAEAPVCQTRGMGLSDDPPEALGLTLDAATCHILGPGVDLEVPGAQTGWSEEPCDLLLHGRSASGRYLGVSTYLGEGDYVHRELRIADLQTGQLLEGLSADVVYSSEVSWSPDQEALVVEGVLWSLGEAPRVTELGGPSVWWLP